MSNSEYLYETEDNYRAAVDARILENRIKGHLNRFEDQELLKWLSGYSYGFYGSLYQSICTYGKLTTKQMECAKRGYAKAQDERAQAEAKEAEFMKTVEGLTKHNFGKVIKGGKRGAIVSSGEGDDATFKIDAINLRKGDSLITYWANDDYSKVVLGNRPYAIRWDHFKRDSYEVYMKF